MTSVVRVSTEPDVWIRTDTVSALAEKRVRGTRFETGDDGVVRSVDRISTIVELANGNSVEVPDMTPTEIAYALWDMTPTEIAWEEKWPT